jgi:hypothetical protein
MCPNLRVTWAQPGHARPALDLAISTDENPDMGDSRCPRGLNHERFHDLHVVPVRRSRRTSLCMVNERYALWAIVYSS